MKAKTAAERKAAQRERMKAKGWTRRDYYATPEEHLALAQLLYALREGKN